MFLVTKSSPTPEIWGAYDYLVVGAGPYGATFAHEAAQHGKRVLVIDRRNHIGGNMYTEKIHGINKHVYGAHIFHTGSQRIWDYVNHFTEFNGYINQVIANYHGELYNLPFNMNTFYQMWGVRTPAQAKAKIAEQRESANVPKPPRNLAEQAISLIGTDLYTKLVKGYTEKQWGRPATELPPEIIKRLPVRFTFDNNYFNHRYQGVPVDGYTVMFDRMLASPLIDVVLDTDFFDHRDYFMAHFPRIVYTGMIDQFFGYVAGELEYRSVRFSDQLYQSDNVQGNAVINYTDAETPYTRTMEWRHFDGHGDPGLSLITTEYPQAWNRSKEAYYPVTDAKNRAIYREYAQLAETVPQVLFGGRLGQYKYYDMDQVFAAALQAAAAEFG